MEIKAFSPFYPDFDKIRQKKSFFEQVKEDYQKNKRKSLFHKYPREAFFIYQMTSPTRNHLGLVGMCNVLGIFNDKIIKHENTLLEKEQHHLKLFNKRGAVVKPVLLGHDDNTEIDAFIKDFIAHHNPFFEFDYEDESHRVWDLTQKYDIEHIKEMYAAVNKYYIADGHHRVATHLRLAKEFPTHHSFKYLPFWTMQFKYLHINPYHRFIQCNLPYRFLENYFDIYIESEFILPETPLQFSVFHNNKWYHCKWKDNFLEQHPDPSLPITDYGLIDILFSDIQEKDPTAKINYIEGNITVAEVEKDHAKGFFFWTHPLPIETLVAYAEAKVNLPPKSTWFEPRVKNGVFIQEYTY